MGLQDGREESPPRVVIVGAGVGGVATAARLAAAGCKVTVVEKNDFSGGRCSLIHKEGYVRINCEVETAIVFFLPEVGIDSCQRFDQGPSLLLLPQLFHETFQDLGTSLADEGI